MNNENPVFIYLIRHGETEYNRLGIVQGCGVDASLNAKGERQARAFFNAYEDVAFDKIYTSALKRSIESVQQFIDLGIPWEAHAGLNEISWGDKDGVIANQQDNNEYYDIIRAWNVGQVDKCIEGGESPLDIVSRQKPVIEKIIKREEEQKILICMHGRAMRILLCTLLNKSLKNMDHFKHQNLGLYLLMYDGKAFNLEKSNNGEHL